MLRLSRRKELARAATLAALLECNVPPLDEERLGLQARLQKLKSKYEEICGTTYVSGGLIPKAGRKLHEDIQCHLCALSPIRNVPLEIWHAIFEQAVSSDNGSPHRHTLQRIRSVSRAWNAAACSCPTLWCNLPLIDASVPQSHPPQTGDDVVSILRLYLSRSGTMPISFTYHSSQNPGVQAAEGGGQLIVTPDYLTALIAESHRWGVANFRVSMATLDVLADMARSRHLPTPLLSSFRFELLAIVPARPAIAIDLFHDAPRLKHVAFDALGQWSTVNSTNIKLLLPWKQLESFEGVFQRDMVYTELLAHATKLRALKYISNSLGPVASVTAFSRTLTELKLHFGDAVPKNVVFSHLRSLALPALKELEVYSWSRPSDNLFGAILGFVERSGGSLERLAVEPNLDYNGDHTFPLLKHLLFQCATLTHLDIAYLSDRGLGSLVFNSTNPRLSYLRVLTLRRSPRIGEPFPTVWTNPLPVLRILHSRRQLSGGLQSRLEDVYVKLVDSDNWRWKIMRRGKGLNGIEVDDLRVPFDDEMLGIAVRWKLRLLRCFPEPSKPAPLKMLEEEVQALLTSMEKFDPQARDTRMFSWVGVPAILYSIAAAQPTKDPLVDAYVQRIGALLNKWMPQLIFDFRRSSYRWCYIDDRTSRIRYSSIDEFESTGFLSKAEIQKDWARILGKGDIDGWGVAVKGSSDLWSRPLTYNS